MTPIEASSLSALLSWRKAITNEHLAKNAVEVIDARYQKLAADRELTDWADRLASERSQE